MKKEMKKKRIWSVMILVTACLLFVITPLKAQAAETKNPFDALEQVKDKISDVFENMDTETAEEMFSFLKEKVKGGALDSEDKLQKAITEAQDKFELEIDPADAKKLVETMDKLEDMGFSAEDVIDKTQKLYEKYGADFVEHTEEIIANAVKETATSVVEGFFNNLADGIGHFFKNMFS